MEIGAILQVFETYARCDLLLFILLIRVLHWLPRLREGFKERATRHRSLHILALLLFPVLTLLPALLSLEKRFYVFLWLEIVIFVTGLAWIALAVNIWPAYPLLANIGVDLVLFGGFFASIGKASDPQDPRGTTRKEKG